DGQGREPGTEILDELSDHTRLPEDLRHGEDEIRRRRTLRQRTAQTEADDLWYEHRHRFAEHRRLRLDPTDAPTEHAEPVDHRRVRVGPDERVGIRGPVSRFDDTCEVLEVDLMHDARVRRHDLEVGEGRLSPTQERIALSVALELELRIAAHRARRRVLVDLV